MDNTENLNLEIDFDEIKSHADYKKIWERFSPVKVQMIEKNEECLHNLSDSLSEDHYLMHPLWVFDIELTRQIIVFIVSSLTLLFALRKYSLKIFKGKIRGQGKKT